MGMSIVQVVTISWVTDCHLICFHVCGWKWFLFLCFFLFCCSLELGQIVLNGRNVSTSSTQIPLSCQYDCELRGLMELQNQLNYFDRPQPLQNLLYDICQTLTGLIRRCSLSCFDVGQHATAGAINCCPNLPGETTIVYSSQLMTG